MSISRLGRKATAAAVLAGAFVVGSAAPAFAHVTVSPGSAPSGGYAKIDVRVPHGCEDAATQTVRVQIPEGINAITPQVVTGWEIEVVKQPLNPPVPDGHGGQLTERESEVIWRGGPLASDQLQEFGISLKLPELPAGDKLYFPAVQECVGGTQSRWVEIPAAGQDGEELENPAPSMTLTAASDGHGGAADVEESDDSDVLPVIATILGGLGLATGLTALFLARRKQT